MNSMRTLIAAGRGLPQGPQRRARRAGGSTQTVSACVYRGAQPPAVRRAETADRPLEAPAVAAPDARPGGPRRLDSVQS